MTTIYLSANDQDLVATIKPTVASGCQNSVALHVDFSSEWDGYAKSGVFFTAKDDTVFEAVMTQGECVIPSGVINESGILFIGIRGIDAENNKVKTTSLVKYKIVDGSPECEDAPTRPEPEPDIYDQLLTAYGKTDAAIQKEVSERKAADAEEASARKEADAIEKSERQTADNKEATERKAEIAVERARIDSIIASKGSLEYEEYVINESNPEVKIITNKINAAIVVNGTLNQGTGLSYTIPNGLEPLATITRLYGSPRTDLVYVLLKENNKIELHNMSGTNVTGTFYFGYGLKDVTIPELNDLRIGVDGKKYENAGEAVRQQIINSKEYFTNLIENKLDKNQGTVNSGKVLGIGDDGNVLPVEMQSSSALIYKKLNEEWNRGMCATNGSPMPDIEGNYIWINMQKGDKFIINGFANDASFVTLQMEKGYSQPIWNYVKCQDDSSIVDYNKANVNIENLKIECIKEGILCVNSKLKKDLFKEVKVTFTEVVDMIPTKTSQLKNDSKYVDEEKITQESNKIKELIPTKTSQLENDSEFLEKSTAIEEIDKRVGLNKLQIHDVIYGITGSPMQIFKHSIMSSDMNLDVFVKMKNTFNYPRYLLINTLDEGNTVVDMSLTNNNNEMIDTKIITFKGKRPTNPLSRKNVLFIGDSRTYSGDMVLEASRLLSGTQGEATAPKSFDLSNYHVVGRRKKKNIDPNVGYEGNSGWTARTYFLSGVKSLTLTVEGTTTLEIGSTYIYQASNGKRATLMIEEVDGNAIVCVYPSWSSTSALPSSTSGTLTKASGDGDESISFTNYAEGKWSPFLLNGEIDFKHYIDNYCDGQLDCACIWLGINDLIGIGGRDNAEIDFVINDFIVQHLKKMLDKLFEQYPNCKVLLASEVLPSQNGGLATSVEAQYSSLTKGMNYIIHRTNKAYIELASQYQNKCFYLDNNCQFDAINGYDSTEKQVNLRNPKKEQVGSNNVHPNKYGYWQHADSFVRGIINLI